MQKGSQDFFHTFTMTLYHKWGVKNGFTFALQFFLPIFDGLGVVYMLNNQSVLGINWLDEPLAEQYLEFVEIDPGSGLWQRKLIEDLSNATDCVSTYEVFCQSKHTVPNNSYRF